MVSAWAPGPPSKPSSSNSADGVQLTWAPPLSSGGDPVRCYTVWGRTGGEQGEYVVLRAHIPVAECGGVESPCITVAYAVLPNPSGWWEFGVQAVNSSAQGPRSPPSLPLMVTLPAGSPVKEAPPPTDDTRTRWNSAPAATSSTLPVAPSLGPLTPGSPAAANPALDLLGGVVGTAVATIAKLFSMGAKEARQRSDGFGATPVPQRRASFGAQPSGDGGGPRTNVFTVSSEHEGSCRLDASLSPGGRTPLQPQKMLEALLDAAAASERFPLRQTSSNNLYEWPVRGQWFKHGNHRVEMSLASLCQLLQNSLQRSEGPTAESGLPERLRHLDLVPNIMLHVTHGAKGAKLVLDADPTPCLVEGRAIRPSKEDPTDSFKQPNGNHGGGAENGGSLNGSVLMDVDPPAAAAVQVPPPKVPSPLRKPGGLRRAATVPLHLDQNLGASANPPPTPSSEELEMHELALRSAYISRLRLSLEVQPAPGGGYHMRVGLSSGLKIELPTPWFVPRVAIEAAGNLLLRVALKIATDQMLHEIIWLDQNEVSRRGGGNMPPQGQSSSGGAAPSKGEIEAALGKTKKGKRG